MRALEGVRIRLVIMGLRSVGWWVWPGEGELLAGVWKVMAR